jgi:hypothetical protein
LLKTPSFLLKLCTEKILRRLMWLILINGRPITILLWSTCITFLKQSCQGLTSQLHTTLKPS